MAKSEGISFGDAVREARERLALELRAQGEKIQKLNLELHELEQAQKQTEQEASRQWDEVAHAADLTAKAFAEQETPEEALDKVLGAVRGLITCTIPEQVLAVLSEEAAQWGVRAAVFDVRGKAAWGAAANGFEPALSEAAVRALIVPLTQESPFRQVCETGGHVDATADSLKKTPKVLDRFKPAPRAPILLLPVRSAGAVAAIFYVDPGDNSDPLPVNGLKILAEFAGAQIDRLVGLSGGFASDDGDHDGGEVAGRRAQGDAAHEEAEAAEPAPAEPVMVDAIAESPEVMAVMKPPTHAPAQQATHGAAAAAAPGPGIQNGPTPSLTPPSTEGAAQEAPPPPAVDITQLSEADQKIHKDARRFAKLLVSEIELYNRPKVAEGRKNRDLYVRLKSDIDRSRQTFEKRFGKSLSKQFDYFHEELVKVLALNEPAALGPDYPGRAA